MFACVYFFAKFPFHIYFCVYVGNKYSISQWWNNAFQDLVKKPEYSLILRKKTAAVNYFSYANSSTMMYQSILWERFKDDPSLFAENYEMAENILLQNSYKVFFGSALGGAKTSMPNYPCLIHATSKILEKVLFDWNLPLKPAAQGL